MIKFTSKSRAIKAAMVKPIAVDNQFKGTAKTVVNSKALNFLSSFKVNYYFLRFFGLWPFSLVRDPNGEIRKCKIRKLDLLWFIISMPLYVSASFVFYKNSQTESKILKFTTKVISSGDNIRIAISLISVALAIAIDMCNRFKLINMLNMFVRFDESVSVSVLSNSILKIDWFVKNFIVPTWCSHSGIIIGNRF